jgi:TrmH family RNA methyltransferase
LKAGKLPDSVVIDRDVELASEIQDLIRQTPSERLVILEPGLFRTLSDVVSTQGILFVVTPPQEVLPPTIHQNCVLLDRVQDPGNVGTILRTAAAAGVRLIIASEQTAGLWSPKVLRSAQGAHFSLSLHERVDLNDLLGQIEIPSIATTLEGSTALYGTALPETCAWIFGNEGQGVGDELCQRASMRIRVPIDASAVESLNVAVCAALCLYEQRRQHAGTSSFATSRVGFD